MLKIDSAEKQQVANKENSKKLFDGHLRVVSTDL